MKSVGGVLVLAVAMLLASCSAAPHQELDLNEHATQDHSDPRFDDQKTRNLDPLGGGNLVRSARDVIGYPYGLTRRFDDWSPLNEVGGPSAKRNFDEIDHTNMPFPYASKRFVRYYGPSYLGSADFDRKRNRADFPMDEIDLSQFPIGSKRSFNDYPLLRHAFR